MPHAWLEHRLNQIEERIGGHAAENRNNFAEMRKDLAVIAVHKAQIDALQDDVRDVRNDLKVVTGQANKIAGIGAALAVMAGIVSGWFKHG